MSTKTTTALPTVTRTAVAGGKFRYESNGKVVTKASKREYTHASVYELVTPSDYDRSVGRSEGTLFVFLHGRADLAFKGHSHFNQLTSVRRVPGVAEIQEV